MNTTKMLLHSHHGQCRYRYAGFVIAVTALFVTAVQSEKPAIDLSSVSARAKTVQALESEAQFQKEEALAVAAVNGLPVRGTTPDGATFELMKIAGGEPLYYITHNKNAAITTAAHRVRNTAPYLVNGTGLIAGAWDDGVARATHVEFGGRAAVMDGSTDVATHATLVCGTLGAAGLDARALGMAPSVTIHSYDWDADYAEMTANAATGANQPDKIYVSNHAYGYGTGWEGNYFYGGKTQRQDPDFGVYGMDARDWDTLCYNAPYYLPFKSAGNDRDDHAPAEGATYYYLSWNTWQSDIYYASTGPLDDGAYGGWNTIAYHGVAKNAITVGAVNEAVSGGQRDLSAATMTTFSSWGPVNDGRIKPDIVADGYSLYSCLSASTYGYLTGTSAASANAAGSALLLVEYYRSLFPGQDMRSSMLKGLILHTADDLGVAGPDFKYGWGLMNTEAAANHIREHAGGMGALKMVEGILDAEQPSRTYMLTLEAHSPLRATLCWTDPPGEALSWTDPTVPALVNDLDLRILGPGGVATYYPYRLNNIPLGNPAMAGDNTQDNIEQVRIASLPEAGLYTFQVTHKSTLINGEQAFSLLITGDVHDVLDVEPESLFTGYGEVGGPFTPPQTAYTLTNTGSIAVTWTAVKDTGLDWADLSAGSGVLGVDESNTITLTINSVAAELQAGTHSRIPRRELPRREA